MGGSPPAAPAGSAGVSPGLVNDGDGGLLLTMSDVLERRSRLLEQLSPDGGVDVLIIGGGINGAGALLDAASRGFDAVLMERDDLGVGTSSRSSKLIHGGLRYLEHFDFGLVREALAERDVLTRLAPHLVALRRFVVPVVGGRWQIPYIGSGMVLYDLLGGRRGGHFQVFGPDELVRRVPAVDPTTIVGGFEYTDGVCDDVRVVIAAAETARRHGGRYLTHTEVIDVTAVASGWEVEVVDRLSGEKHTVEARSVIDMTGAFEVDELEFATGRSLTASRGIHLVLPGETFGGNRGMTIRVPGRVVFVIPWGRRWLLGTTDVAHHGPVDRPAATLDEVDYLLEAANEVLATDLTRDDVLTTYAGIRPLAGLARGDTSDVSREHRIQHDDDGFVSVRGGKYTTYRLIAAEAVDEVVDYLGSSRPSRTDGFNLIGAASPMVLEQTVHDLVAEGLDPVEARWLVGRHGTEAPLVLDAGRTAGLEGRLHPDMPYVAAEAWWAIHREGALTLDDVLARRTRLAIETADHGLAAAPRVAELLADVHGWSPADTETAIATYTASSTREYGVPT